MAYLISPMLYANYVFTAKISRARHLVHLGIKIPSSLFGIHYLFS